MTGRVGKALLVLLIPVATLGVGLAALGAIRESARREATLPCRYSVEEARDYWDRLSDRGRSAEKMFLWGDLAFPLLYGAAFAYSLGIARRSIGRPERRVWLLGPVALLMLADWTENVAQLSQIDAASVDARVVRIASAATDLKWSLLGVTTAILVGTAILVLRGRPGRPPAQ